MGDSGRGQGRLTVSSDLTGRTDEEIRLHLKGVAQDLELPTEAQRIVIQRSERPKKVTIRSQYTVELVLPFKHKEIVLRPIAEFRQ